MTRAEPRKRPRAPVSFFEIVVTASVAVTPLALLPGVFISHDVIPKVVLLFCWAGLLLFLLPQWLPGLLAFSRKKTGILFLGLVGAQFASLLFSTLSSTQPGLSLSGTVWRRFGLLEQTACLIVAAAVACAAFSRPAWVTTLLRAISVSGGLNAVYGILQYFNLDPFLERRLYSVDYFGGVTRPPGTLGHALYYSAWLAPVFFLALASVFRETKPFWKYVHGAVAALAAVAVLLSGTRSALLALAGGGILFVARRRVSRRYLAVAAAVLLAAVGFVYSPAGSNLRVRMNQWRTETGGPRFQMWLESRALIAQHPFLGGGPETFAVEFRRIQSAQLSKQYPEFYNETPHNALIDAACAQGIPGLLILAGVFVLVFFAGNRARGFQPAALAALICSLFASLTLTTSLYLWVLASLAAATSAGEVKVAKTAPARWTAALRLPATAAGILLLAAALVAGYLDSAWMDLGRAIAAGNVPDARDAYAEATLFGDRVPGYELWASRQWASFGRSLGNTPDGAEAWKTAAAAASLAETGGEERFSAAYQSSVLAIAASDPVRAELEARRAVALAPNWYKGHLLLSQILQLKGNQAGALQEAQVSEGLGWKK